MNTNVTRNLICTLAFVFCVFASAGASAWHGGGGGRGWHGGWHGGGWHGGGWHNGWHGNGWRGGWNRGGWYGGGGWRNVGWYGTGVVGVPYYGGYYAPSCVRYRVCNHYRCWIQRRCN